MSKNKWRKSRSTVIRKMRLVMPEADIAIKEIEQAQTREEARKLIGVYRDLAKLLVLQKDKEVNEALSYLCETDRKDLIERESDVFIYKPKSSIESCVEINSCNDFIAIVESCKIRSCWCGEVYESNVEAIEASSGIDIANSIVDKVTWSEITAKSTIIKETEASRINAKERSMILKAEESKIILAERSSILESINSGIYVLDGDKAVAGAGSAIKILPGKTCERVQVKERGALVISKGAWIGELAKEEGSSVLIL